MRKMNKSAPRGKVFLTVNLIFIALIVSLAGLTFSYWQFTLLPHFEKEFQAQAEILSQSQAAQVVPILAPSTGANPHPAQVIDRLDNILLTADPVTRLPFFASVSLELDYDVVMVEEGTLDLKRQANECLTCFRTEVALFRPDTSELMGVASFEVSDAFFAMFKEDMLSKLIIEAILALALLALVWYAVILLIGKLRKEIDERLRAEEAVRDSERRFQQLANATFEGIMIHKDGVIIDANEAAGVLLEKDVSILNGLSLVDLFPSEVLPVIENLKGDEKERPVEVLLQRSHGLSLHLEVRVRSITKEGGKAQVITFRDITYFKQAEQDLRIARDQSEAATKLKDKFLGLVSHDLRSPLTGVVGTLELLTSPKYEIETPQKIEITKEAHRTLKSLLTLLDDLLNISRLRTGIIRPMKKMVNIRSLVEMYKAHLMPLARKKGIDIQNNFQADFEIHADPSMIGEALQNLISNSIKFCAEGDQVILERSTDSPCSISIRDSGPGIDPALLGDIFKQDIRTTTTGSQGEKGTGLGLPYCHDIVTAHGGEISVSSKPGLGAKFVITLPLLRPTIMVVDDQGGHRAMIRSCIEESFDVEIMEAENGREAIEYLKDVTPQLVIVDIEMPVMNGYSFIKQVRENPFFDAMAIIVATSHRSSQENQHKVIETRQKVFALGADDFVVKPIVPEDLIPRVNRLFSGERVINE